MQPIMQMRDSRGRFIKAPRAVKPPVKYHLLKDPIFWGVALYLVYAAYMLGRYGSL